MIAAEHVTGFEDRLRGLRFTAAGRAERPLFRELNPSMEHSPILKAAPQKPRPASVLIPILSRGESHTVLLTVRAPTMPSHAGEISFPGGGPRKGDVTPVDTALREAHEEVGISRDHIDVMSQFGPHHGGLGYIVTPVVGLVNEPPEIRPCAREVSEAFEVPLDHFLNLDNHVVVDRRFGEIDYKMFAVPYGGGENRRFIWGLTAGILHTFAMAWHGRPLKP